ncbi:hypothetical protein [Methanospirillum lacunae]|nr:hypothetical protein [Methanospirillum lacunae]
MLFVRDVKKVTGIDKVDPSFTVPVIDDRLATIGSSVIRNIRKSP